MHLGARAGQSRARARGRGIGRRARAHETAVRRGPAPRRWVAAERWRARGGTPRCSSCGGGRRAWAGSDCAASARACTRDFACRPRRGDPSQSLPHPRYSHAARGDVVSMPPLEGSVLAVSFPCRPPPGPARLVRSCSISPNYILISARQFIGATGAQGAADLAGDSFSERTWALPTCAGGVSWASALRGGRAGGVKLPPDAAVSACASRTAFARWRCACCASWRRGRRARVPGTRQHGRRPHAGSAWAGRDGSLRRAPARDAPGAPPAASRPVAASARLGWLL